MPGIGPRTGARILAEIGDGSAFANGSKLAAYAGLAPVTHQSGTTLAGETRSAVVGCSRDACCLDSRTRCGQDRIGRTGWAEMITWSGS